MSKQMIYQYESRDPNTQQWVLSRRMATREFINMVQGKELRILEETATAVDGSLLDSSGQTELDFVPSKR